MDAYTGEIDIRKTGRGPKDGKKGEQTMSHVAWFQQRTGIEEKRGFKAIMKFRRH